MVHLIVSREYPPAPYPAGGIGTYARQMAQLLAESGEIVHVIAQRWDGAPEKISEFFGGRLIVHRVSLDEPIEPPFNQGSTQRELLRRLASSTCPSQVFSWQATQYAESLLRTEPIDLIEGQEWEAPLYYLQVRRALGLGPRREPPCLVHLHSPSQMIFRHNEWDETLTDFLPLTRFEEYTIRAADALVCPSRYLAHGVADLFGLDAGRIEIIPYPMGDTPRIERKPAVWAADSICYVGRLELRKGLVEWVDAAVRVAGSHPTVRFDFVGSDTSLGGGVGRSVREHLQERIPSPLRPRFRFNGGQTRTALLQILARVPVVAVPSRWENLPFTCIEAMSTGLPVLVSPNGGMAELVTDGQSGWVAPDGTPAGLEAAILRVLNTSPQQREAMGRQASEAVRRICNNRVVLRRHMELRSRIAQSGPANSRQIPASRPLQANIESDRKGIGIVVVCLDDPELLIGCIEAVCKQTLPATTVVVAAERHRNEIERPLATPANAASQRLLVLYTSVTSARAATRLGVKALLAAEPRLRAIATLDQTARVETSYAGSCESVFERQPGVGLVAPWLFYEGPYSELDPGPCPVDLVKATGSGLPPGAAVRVEVMLAAQRTQDEEADYSVREALASGGWTAVTYPGPLVSLIPPVSGGEQVQIRPERRYSVMALAQSGSAHFALKWFLAAPWGEKARWVREAIGQPRRILRWIVWQARLGRAK